MKYSKPQPRWVFDIWANGSADYYCSQCDDLPVSRFTRLFWKIRGIFTMCLFGWWWWTK